MQPSYIVYNKCIWRVMPKLITQRTDNIIVKHNVTGCIHWCHWFLYFLLIRSFIIMSVCLCLSHLVLYREVPLNGQPKQPRPHSFIPVHTVLFFQSYCLSSHSDHSITLFFYSTIPQVLSSLTYSLIVTIVYFLTSPPFISTCPKCMREIFTLPTHAATPLLTPLAFSQT